MITGDCRYLRRIGRCWLCCCRSASCTAYSDGRCFRILSQTFSIGCLMNSITYLRRQGPVRQGQLGKDTVRRSFFLSKSMDDIAHLLLGQLGQLVQLVQLPRDPISFLSLSVLGVTTNLQLVRLGRRGQLPRGTIRPSSLPCNLNVMLLTCGWLSCWKAIKSDFYFS